MTNTNFFNGFDAVPAFAPFQNMFADANERSQDLAKRSQKVAGELADLARANVEAIVEAGRVASEGARSMARKSSLPAVTVSRRPPTRSVRSPKPSRRPSICSCRASSPVTSFDRAVAESPKLTELLVKLAGEAFQPLSNRATANAERFNTLVA